MKKSVLAAAAAVFAFTGTASAADMDYDRQVGLIVSGVVDKWAGVQIIDDGVSDETVFANGGEGRLSLPLGDNLSIQSDVKYEYNSNAFDPAPVIITGGPRYSYLGAAHLSWRDPSSFLLGMFGGAATVDNAGIDTFAHFVGGEAQFYVNNVTLYAQAGYVDYSQQGFAPNIVLDEGFFARGVLRWFLGNGSRLQLSGQYSEADYITGFGTPDMKSFAIGARYDFDLNLPIAGQTPLFIGYRGVFTENCTNNNDFADTSEHTIMVGTSYSFSGDRITVDRSGATLDTPDFHSCFGGVTFTGG
jgi:hypothetical protein